MRGYTRTRGSENLEVNTLIEQKKRAQWQYHEDDVGNAQSWDANWPGRGTVIEHVQEQKVTSGICYVLNFV
jgi:hypothetical protein